MEEARTILYNEFLFELQIAAIDRSMTTTHSIGDKIEIKQY